MTNEIKAEEIVKLLFDGETFTRHVAKGEGLAFDTFFLCLSD